MRKISLLLLASALLLSPTVASAQSSPGLVFGQVPTPAQWNSYFAAKQDVLGFSPVNRAGDTMQGELITSPSATGGAGLSLPHGVAPTSPVNGDVWTTTGGLFARINGSTVGPFATGAGGLTVGTSTVASGTPGRVLFDNSGVLGEYATVPLANGGTNNSLTASAGGIPWSDASKLNILAGTSTPGQCLLSGNLAAPTWGSCSGAAAVSSVTDSGAGTLTISPTTGAVLAALNLSHANTWAALQTFTNSTIKLLGSSTGGTTFTSANAGASNFTLTVPGVTDTLAVLGTNQTHSATQTFSGTLNASGTFQIAGNAMTFPGAPATISQTIASGGKVLATGAIGSGTCTSAQTDTATGALTTDAVIATFNADPSGTTGYSPTINGMLTILAYPTSGTVNYKVCNNTAASITPGAVTINWRVVR